MALDANCHDDAYTKEPSQQAQALEPGRPITEYRHLKECSAVAGVPFQLRRGSSDKSAIAIMTAILSVAAVPDTNEFECVEYSGYWEVAVGIITLKWSEAVRAVAAGCDAFDAVTGTAA